jgi:hypothetical protein
VRHYGAVAEVQFSVREDGQVDARLGPDRPIFTEALGDSISSLPPRGAAGVGPSTYWIDLAEAGATAAAEAGTSAPFTSGNITELRVRDGCVVATYDFADPDEPGDALPLPEFLELLREWRGLVLASAARCTEPLPQTYRRNPAR